MATAKRRSDRGSVRFSRGAWRISVGAGNRPDGSRRTLYGTVRAPDTPEGRKAATDRMYDLVREARVLRDANHPGKATLGGIVDDYLAWGEIRGGKNKSGWSPNTLRNYHDFAEKYVLSSRLADRPANEIRVHELEALYDTTPTYHVRLALHRLVRAALARAVRRELLERNVADMTEKMARPKSKVRPPAPEAVRDALYLLEREDPFFHAFVRLAALTGARRGSLCGLTWDAVNLDAGRVRFFQAVARGKGRKAGGFTVKGLKAENVYTVDLDDETVAVLRRHRSATAAARLAAPASALDWVFPAVRRPGTPLSVDAMTARWGRIRREIPGLETTRLHDLRHYVATQLFAAGASAIDVAERLGHERPSTTLDIYGDSIEKNNRAASNYLAGLIGGAEEEAPSPTPLAADG